MSWKQGSFLSIVLLSFSTFLVFPLFGIVPQSLSSSDLLRGHYTALND